MRFRSIVALSLAAACTLLLGGALPAAGAEAPVVVTSADALQNAFASAPQGATVQLGADLGLASLDVPTGIALVLDLGGHTLTVDNRGDSGAAIGVPSDAALTIEDTSSAKTGKLSALAALGAGIGGGNGGNASAGTITITGGSVTAESGEGAGIGGGNTYGDANGGMVTISGGTVTATGGAASGIGGGNAGGSGDANGGTVTISGGTVTATGSSGGAGIGGGSSPGASDGAQVIISGGTVTATGSSGAGIGGGAAGSSAGGGSVTISGGTVTATGSGGAGIGGGSCRGAGPAGGAAVTVGAHGSVTVSAAGNAIGPGTGVDSPPGSFQNAGNVTVASGIAVLSNAKNSGTIRNEGTIAISGSLTNDGTILGTAPTPVSAVTGNNYTITTKPGSTVQILAANAEDAGVSLPAPPATTPTGKRFAGWSGTTPSGQTGTVSQTSSLRADFGPGPVAITLADPVWKTLPPEHPQGAPSISAGLLWFGGIAGLVILLGVIALIFGARARKRAR